MNTVYRTFLGAALLLASTVVSAQATRTWVSGVGDDANPCSRTAPCKTFAGAISKTAAGGVINTLDPGGFGAVTITKAITLEAEGQVAGILNAGSNGVIINAGANDRVTLRNLRINGAGSGFDGVRILGGSTVSIEDCVIENIVGNAIDVANTTGNLLLTVKNTRINGVASSADPGQGDAIRLAPTGTGTVVATIQDSIVRSRNHGLTLIGVTEVVLRDTSFLGGAGNGIQVINQANVLGDVLVDKVIVQDFGGFALSADGSKARIRVSDSMIYGNGTAIGTANAGFVQSFGNNRVIGHANPSSFSGTLTFQ